MSGGDQGAGFRRIAARVAPGAEYIDSQPLRGGTSARMTLIDFRPRGNGLKRMVVRTWSREQLERDPSRARREYLLLLALERSSVPAPRALFLDESCELLPTPYIVTTFVEGDVDFCPADPARSARDLADHLSALHTLPIDDDMARLLSRGGGLWAETEREPCGAHELRTLEASIRARLRPVSRPASSPGASLIHGDFWPGNIVWKNGRLSAIVDWEDARLGVPFEDLAVARLDAFWILGPSFARALTERYAERSLDIGPDQASWDLCAVLRLIRLSAGGLGDWVSFFHERGRTDITTASFCADLKRFAAEAGLR